MRHTLAGSGPTTGRARATAPAHAAGALSAPWPAAANPTHMPRIPAFGVQRPHVLPALGIVTHDHGHPRGDPQAGQPYRYVRGAPPPARLRGGVLDDPPLPPPPPPRRRGGGGGGR